MIVGPFLRVAATFVCVLAQSTAPGLSQQPEPGLRSTLPEAEADPAAGCGSAAAFYSGRGASLWVTRRGTMLDDNPLRPLSRDALLVLQVHVNRRLATAFGPDLDNLRQGGPPQALEKASGHPIAWDPAPMAVPRSLRIVGEDGAVLLGPLQFQSCGPAPPASAASTPPSRAAGEAAERRRPAPAPAAEKPRPNLSLPQGAIR